MDECSLNSLHCRNCSSELEYQASSISRWRFAHTHSTFPTGIPLMSSYRTALSVRSCANLAFVQTNVSDVPVQHVQCAPPHLHGIPSTMLRGHMEAIPTALCAPPCANSKAFSHIHGKSGTLQPAGTFTEHSRTCTASPSNPKGYSGLFTLEKQAANLTQTLTLCLPSSRSWWSPTYGSCHHQGSTTWLEPRGAHSQYSKGKLWLACVHD